MLSRSVSLLQQLAKTNNSRRYLSLKQLNPIINRNLAWFSGQSTKKTFGERLKRRLKNFLIVTVIGFGTYYGFTTGWGAVPLLKHIDTEKYEAVCVSPRNYFLMTPLLPPVSVAHCVSVDPKAKVISCNTDGEQPVSRGDDVKTILIPSRRAGGSSSRIIKDSGESIHSFFLNIYLARVRPSLDMKYDILVGSVGSENNTFNTPGIEEHAHFLKEVLDARRIRSAISDAFESAMTPTQTPAKRKRLLHFVVVGGGPTGVEFAAELADLVREDLQIYFPRLVANDVKIALIEALDHILSMRDKQISDYTERHFHRENIDVLMNTFVKEVKQHEVVVQLKGSDELKSIPCSVVVWATGIKPRALTNKLREIIGFDIQSNRMGLTYRSIFTLLFEEADTERRGTLDLQQFRALVERKITEFPQLEIISKSIEKAFEEADKDKSGTLTLAELHSALGKADTKIRALPATAQVASQEGSFVADLLNQLKDTQSNNYEQQSLKSFRYKHMGSLAYVGGDEAVVDFTGSKPILDMFNLKPLSGRSAAYLWKSFYLTEMFTGRTKTLLAFDWVRTQFFGRDISRY
ncbi:unnamed protein product [Rotaria magnacalcarata]|uniref:NADH:ubiquinone reductase (non-electrogenic) n=6 Tax=Rotaria magnacalcarata TaxID=392030 RepID=A0A815V5B2_9BILA|nr:unnamed protein product [Rotaria magnacalcarata]